MALETKTTSLLQISLLISPGCLLSIFTCVTTWGLEFSLLTTEATIISFHCSCSRSLLLYMAPRGLDQWSQTWASYPQQLSFTPHSVRDPILLIMPSPCSRPHVQVYCFIQAIVSYWMTSGLFVGVPISRITHHLPPAG